MRRAEVRGAESRSCRVGSASCRAGVDFRLRPVVIRGGEAGVAASLKVADQGRDEWSTV